MKIGVAAEVCSFPLMQEVKAHLIEEGYDVVDMGMISEDDPQVFYETAPRIARAIQNGEIDRGIVMCGTGMGVCLVCNKFKGVYCGLAESVSTAKRHYVINRTNVLAMGGWIVGKLAACDMVDAWLTATIGEGFSEERKAVQAAGFYKIQEMEEENFK